MVCTKVYVIDQVKCLALDLNLDPYSVKYLIRRYQNEGIKFLTSTLPVLSKSIIASFEKGFFDRPTNFSWKGRSLLFCNSLLVKIFDSSGYVIQDNPEQVANALSSIRQLCEYFYKVAFSFSLEEKLAAYNKYLDKEKENRRATFSPKWADQLRKNFETYYTLSKYTVADMYSSRRPRNTTGAFNTETNGIPYWLYRLLPAETIGLLPRALRSYSGFFKSYPSSRERISFTDETRRCKVLFVPKDSRGPRTISKEPLGFLKAQMSFFDFATRILTRDTCGRIEFDNQEKFRELARIGSVNGEWATLDLKDASDSVITRLIRVIGRNSPIFRHAINHLRSTHASLPFGQEIQLEKLAGMGSGLTFPTMALLIHLSCSTAISEQAHIPFKEAMKLVYVYGDDLIVPKRYFDIVAGALRASCLVLNTEKSFKNGRFRESCGGDYYHGIDVTPVRLKLSKANLDESLSYNRSKVKLITKKNGLEMVKRPLVLHDIGTLELERHCRELVDANLYCVSEYLYTRLERSIGPLPYVSRRSNVLGRYDSEHMIYNYPTLGCSREPLKAYVPSPIEVDLTDKVCPIKGIAMSLQPTNSVRNYPFEFGELIKTDIRVQKPYGVLAIPREIKLTRRPVGINDLLVIDLDS